MQCHWVALFLFDLFLLCILIFNTNSIYTDVENIFVKFNKQSEDLHNFLNPLT